MQTKVVMYNNTTSSKIMLSNIVKNHSRSGQQSCKIVLGKIMQDLECKKSGMLFTSILCQDLDDKSWQNYDKIFC